MTAPLVLFVFNRADKTERVLAAVKDQTVRPARIIVFSDGPRGAEDEPKVAAVRRLVRGIGWAEVVVRERDRNLGCSPNELQGLDEVFEREEAAVILEDDVRPGRCWCEAMNILLEHYKAQPQVFSVGGYPMIKRDALPGYPYDVILSPRFNGWGWGTWSSRWRAVRGELLDYRSPYRKPLEVPVHAGFDLPFIIETIPREPLFHWDSKLAILCLCHGWLNAQTKHYLVNNIGTDSGDHGSAEGDYSYQEYHSAITEEVPQRFAPAVLVREVHEAVAEYVADGYRSAYHCEPPTSRPSLPRRAFDAFRRRLFSSAGPKQGAPP